MAYLGEKIPKLGFGLMRLPMNGEEVDIEQTKEMVDQFMAKGFTYFDTAFGYTGGKSEEAVKTAIVDRYPRESFQIATKLPAWTAANAEDAKEMFNISLKRTGAGYFDFYLLHNVAEERMNSFDDFGIWDYVRELKEKGLIRHIGFSFHDNAQVLDKVLTAHPEMEFVQLQINYADWESPTVQARACYEVAKKHNKPIIIMEPIKGGALANMPDSVRKIFKAADPNASIASWAIRYAASLDNLITVLSGMSTIDQMKDNLSYMESFKPLTEDEKEVVTKAQEVLSAIPSIPCTSCQYCVDSCPQNIKIPDFINAMNRKTIFEDYEGAKHGYGMTIMFGSNKPSECIACGVCESVCPQKIAIIDTLKTAVELFE